MTKYANYRFLLYYRRLLLGHQIHQQGKTNLYHDGIIPARVTYQWVNNPTLCHFCEAIIKRADMLGISSFNRRCLNCMVLTQKPISTSGITVKVFSTRPEWIMTQRRSVIILHMVVLGNSLFREPHDQIFKLTVPLVLRQIIVGAPNTSVG